MSRQRPAAARTDAGYRSVTEADVRVLVFIRMSRALGLSLAQISDWVPASRAGRLRDGQLIDGLQQRLGDIDRDIARLQDLRRRTADHITWARDRQAEAHRGTTGRRKARHTIQPNHQTTPMTHPNHAPDSNPDAQVCDVTNGSVVVELPMQPGLCLRPGQRQATAVFAVADFAAVAAAALLQPDAATSTTDTTLKLVAPAMGERLRAAGRVVHAGARSTVCQADVLSIDAQGEARLCASLLATAHHARLDHAAA